MNLYNPNGTIKVPEAKREMAKKAKKIKEAFVIEKCYCPNGHLLINRQAKFNGRDAIYVKIKRQGEEGFAAISPICGNKDKFIHGVYAENEEIWSFHCPECDVKLPAYSQCSCGGDLISFFLDEKPDFTHLIGICDRVNCQNSILKKGNELLSCTGIDLNKRYK